MSKALFYKEWLKTKWVSIVIVSIGILMLVKIVLTTSYYLSHYSPEVYWYNVIIRKTVFFSLFKYFPVYSALVFGLFQFLPEIINKRLKLSLHLPLGENIILLNMITYGTLILLLIDLILAGSLSLITIYFFPVDLMYSVLLTIIPWFLAGKIVYWILSIVSVEPNWVKRILISAIGYGMAAMLFEGQGYELYKESIIYFLFFGMLFSLGILYTGSRFKKGDS
ncbi:MAG: hypothetical protein JXB44_16240 [Calditrichaceae bacterium]|nr:hypothetical protein [Calditrichaceae bacterium]